MRRLFSVLLILIMTQLIGCNIPPPTRDGSPNQDVDVSNIPNAVPKVEPFSRYGNSPEYTVNGHTYHVIQSSVGYAKTGIASWYGTKFHGHLTSDREIFDMFGMTAANTELPLPTFVYVTNLENGRQVIVKVNDRGPFNADRIIDLSYAAAKKLGFANKGTTLVKVTAIDPHTWHDNNTLPTTVPITHKPRIYLQAGAFQALANAESLKTRITKLTQAQVTIKQGTYNNLPIYRVRIGPLANVPESDRIEKLLENHDIHVIAIVG